MIEITRPTLTLTLEGEDVDRFKSLIDGAQRKRLYYDDVELARELAEQLGMEPYWGTTEF